MDAIRICMCVVLAWSIASRHKNTANEMLIPKGSDRRQQFHPCAEPKTRLSDTQAARSGSQEA